MTQPLPPELQAIAQHYAQTPGSGVPQAPPQHQAYAPQPAAAAPQANPYAPTAAAPPPPPPAPPVATALGAVTPPPGYYRASDGRDYPIPAHLTQPSDVRPETVYAPPQAVAPAPAAPPAQPNPYAPPAHVVPALIANQTQQPLPINPPEVVAALDPNAPPPAERPAKGRSRKPKAAEAEPKLQAAGEAVGLDLRAAAIATAADASRGQVLPGTTLDDALRTASIEELCDELAFRGWVPQLTRRS